MQELLLILPFLLPQILRATITRCGPSTDPNYVSACVLHVGLQISSLLIVEHKSGSVAGPTLNTVTAAAALGGPITALIGGQGVSSVAEKASKIKGISKVRMASQGLCSLCRIKSCW